MHLRSPITPTLLAGDHSVTKPRLRLTRELCPDSRTTDALLQLLAQDRIDQRLLALHYLFEQFDSAIPMSSTMATTATLARAKTVSVCVCRRQGCQRHKGCRLADRNKELGRSLDGCLTGVPTTDLILYFSTTDTRHDFQGIPDTVLLPADH